ncbi:FAD-dependent oxidoreductase [Jeotgalibacillus sp. S-D1]|uniref:dihydrolipoyl dehydrogenase family protein n=1 Tax=Jeotgalibacillus sp. S-D1 TaxID=2552189 RepID=UPI0010599F7E|nr:FAD-dependent oxidoreductase [Jeotgalibacillus sp. S-D1]TDL35261.1 FAD-dependent oxidoreductase [Jeotgalibacillus sp. S-D1]
MVVGEIAEERDVVIIGGGPGGYHAAIRAAQMGKQVTIIEKTSLGGICLAKGCIPSKMFAAAAKKLDDLKRYDRFGINVEDFRFDLKRLHTHVNETITRLGAGVEGLIQANNIELIKGSAYFLSEDRIGVENDHSFTVYRFNSAVIATGSSHEMIEEADNKQIFTSESIYSIEEVPEHLVICGSDYLALETAFTFQQFGSKVSLILDNAGKEFDFDSSVNKEIKRLLKKRKIQLIAGKMIQSIQSEDFLTIHLTEENGAKTKALEATHFVLSARQIPNTASLGINRLKMNMGEEGHIVIDRACRTSIKNIYAVGDVTEGQALAVKAIKQGKTAAEEIAGIPSEADFTFLPTVVHMNPPLSFAGLTEEAARNEFNNVQTAIFPMGGNGFAEITGEREGFIKVIMDGDSELIVGIHIVGQGAVEMASASTLALEMVARAEDLSFLHYPHPSLNEGLLEAVEALTGRAVHLAPKKQEMEKVGSRIQHQ